MHVKWLFLLKANVVHHLIVLGLFTYPSSICHSLEFLLSFPSPDLLRYQAHEKMARRLPNISQLFWWRSREISLSLENYHKMGFAPAPEWITILRKNILITWSRAFFIRGAAVAPDVQPQTEFSPLVWQSRYPSFLQCSSKQGRVR